MNENNSATAAEHSLRGCFLSTVTLVNLSMLYYTTIQYNAIIQQK